MPKFRRKPLVVEAELYRKGFEDGFDGCGRCPTLAESSQESPSFSYGECQLDHHVDFDNIPKAVSDILNICR